MMRILDKYIVKHVMMGIALVSLVIIGLDFIFSFLSELDSLKSEYKIFEALRFTIYSLPRHFYDFMPFIVLIGSLLGLGVMADNRELTIMRAAGVSIARIGFAVMLPVFVVLMFNLGLGEYPAPQLQQAAEMRKDILRSGDDVVSAQQGFWHRDGNNYIHFNAADPKGILYGVTTYSFDTERHLQKVGFAKKAEFFVEDNHWESSFVQEVTLTPEGSHLENYESQVWETKLSPTILKTLVLKPQHQSTSDLYHFSHYLAEQGLASERYLLAFWNKILQPLSIISLVLISLSFVFGSLRSATMGFRVFCGVGAGLLFEYSQDMLGSISLVYGLSPLLATIIPIVLCAGIGTYLLKRVG
jgi:lipopolysaccharide export system permease protein